MQQLGLPQITWRLLRHWGATRIAEGHVPVKAAQERLGYSRPDILLKFCVHFLDESAGLAAETLSGQLSGQPLARQGTEDDESAYWQPEDAISGINRRKLLRSVEARAGIEPAHKGFAGEE